jgi:CubicO group peptidase (beta-lactamase class C family)
MTASLTDPKTKHSDHGPLGTDELELQGRIDGILNRHPAVGLAVGVVRNGCLERFSGHGLADIASNTPITQDTVFRIGSITKTFTAIAVLQLWEQGLVDLDAPANDYLRGYRLIPAKAAHRPATVRQLLTHTAGLPELLYPWRAYTPILGQTVRFGHRRPTLAEFYHGGLHLVVEPGTGCTYSNHGFATLGQLVEDVTGTPLHRYFRERIFEPLAMADTDLVRSERVSSRLATVRWPATGRRLGCRDGPSRIDLLDHHRHGPLCRGAACWWRRRARLDPQPRDPGQHVRPPVPARSAPARDGPGVLPRPGRRAFGRGA